MSNFFKKTLESKEVNLYAGYSYKFNFKGNKAERINKQLEFFSNDDAEIFFECEDEKDGIAYKQYGIQSKIGMFDEY